MRLQDFLIGIGLFAVFTIVIFGAINPNNDGSIYSTSYLNITHDAETQELVSNITTVGASANDDFSDISSTAKGYTAGGEDEERTESNILKGAINFLFSLPKAYQPVANILRMSSDKLGVPPIFTNWILASVIIIFILIIITAVVKNKLET
jgi:hypothetical protein